jgi:hypothetical protein
MISCLIHSSCFMPAGLGLGLSFRVAGEINAYTVQTADNIATVNRVDAQQCLLVRIHTNTTDVRFITSPNTKASLHGKPASAAKSHGAAVIWDTTKCIFFIRNLSFQFWFSTYGFKNDSLTKLCNNLPPRTRFQMADSERPHMTIQ